MLCCVVDAGLHFLFLRFCNCEKKKKREREREGKKCRYRCRCQLNPERHMISWVAVDDATDSLDKDRQD